MPPSHSSKTTDRRRASRASSVVTPCRFSDGNTTASPARDCRRSSDATIRRGFRSEGVSVPDPPRLPVPIPARRVSAALSLSSLVLFPSPLPRPPHHHLSHVTKARPRSRAVAEQDGHGDDGPRVSVVSAVTPPARVRVTPRTERSARVRPRGPTRRRSRNVRRPRRTPREGVARDEGAAGTAMASAGRAARRARRNRRRVKERILRRRPTRAATDDVVAQHRRRQRAR